TQYSAMTGQSLFYMGQTSLKHRILAIAEEEGASRASYAMKLLQSEGELTIASTGTDAQTGNLITQEYRVEGPTMLMMTTTAIDLDEELLNRCLVLTVDEDREQTRRIHTLQREKRTLAGLARKEAKTAILTTHRNAQRLLRGLAVVNPWADQLTFLDDRTRTRRDHEKYLTLIDTIALLHQHQREVKTANVQGRTVEYIEATLADIETANQIAHEVLGRSLDELPPQTRRVLGQIVAHVEARAQTGALRRADVRFTRGELRAGTGTSDTQLKVHLARLAELEYLMVHRAQRGQGYEYELMFDGDASTTSHLSGLIDVQALQISDYDKQRSGSEAQQSAPGRGAVGPVSVGGRMAETPATPALARLTAQSPEKTAKPCTGEASGKVLSYPKAQASSHATFLAADTGMAAAQ
ncbi:MAG: DNA primase, partial [Betaproteobacteria bacterium]